MRTDLLREVFLWFTSGRTRREEVRYMSPEVYINDIEVANVPDETGDYKTHSGEPLSVEFDPENPSRIVIRAAQLAGKPGRRTENGRREFQLNKLGIGAQILPTPEGVVHVRLHEPVFPAKQKGTRYREVVSALRREQRQSWLRGHGRR
jgi:ribosomal protein S8